MNTGEIVRLVSWFVPIPFMLLFHVNTAKLNKLKKFALPVTILLGLISINLGVVGFRPELRTFYLVIICLSYLLFAEKYNFPQAISIAVCLTFFSSVFWEIPYHTFTIIQRGYIDQAFPLHMLYAFPAVLIWQKIQIKQNIGNIFLVVCSLLLSTMGMVFLLYIGADFFQTYKNNPNLWLTTEIIFMCTRVVCFSTVYYLFFNGTRRLRKRRKKDQCK